MSNIRAIAKVDRIANINQGGGNKLQGIPSSTNLNSNAHVAFRNRNVVCACNRNIVFYMNQLGGIGPYNSQFGSSADGLNKKILLSQEEKDLIQFKEFIFSIQQSMQNVISKALNNDVGTRTLDRNINNLNNINNYNLCLVGNRESFFTDLTKIVSDLSSDSNININGMTKKLDIFNSGDEVIFTHLLSKPNPENIIENPLRISRFNDGSEETEFGAHLELIITSELQKKINFCNAYLPTLVPDLFTKEKIQTYGRHTLGIINNNIKISTNTSNNDDLLVATSFMQSKSFGINKLNINTNPPIYIFRSNLPNITNNEIFNKRMRGKNYTNISLWDVSNVTIMEKAFNGATNFNQPIGNWNVSNVTNMFQMFQDATQFNQNITQWDVSMVTNAREFNNNSNFIGLPPFAITAVQ